MPGSRVDVVRWSQALDCADAEELAALLGRACGRADAIAAEVAGLQSSLAGLAGLAEVEQDVHELLLRLGVTAEGVWMVLDHARRAAVTVTADSSSATASVGVR